MDYIKKLVKKILRWEAQLILKKYKPRIIAIAGSVGKTLTKEVIYLILSKKFYIRKTEKSFTTELGIPLTIIGGDYKNGVFLELLKTVFLGFKLIFTKSKYPDWLILELDGDKPGDLEEFSKWVSLDILVLTAIGEVPAHIELFGNIENFIREKKFLLNAIKKDGLVIYNNDDHMTNEIVSENNTRKISCGVKSSADIKGTDFIFLYKGEGKFKNPAGMSFDIKYKDLNYGATILETVGINNEYAVLLAFAVGCELDMTLKDISNSLTKIKPIPGRMRIIPGIKGITIVDDSYNASPIAMHESIDTFKKIKFTNKNRKVVILGDMLEIGKHSADEQRKIAHLLKNGIDFVITVGLRSRKTSEELVQLGFNSANILSFDKSEEAIINLDSVLKEKDFILVKGSQAMRMEKVVEEIMLYPDDKKRLLVRQEDEWLKR